MKYVTLYLAIMLAHATCKPTRTTQDSPHQPIVVPATTPPSAGTQSNAAALPHGDSTQATRSSRGTQSPKPAAESLEKYIDQLKGKRLGLVVNHTSVVGPNTHLVDTLLALGIRVQTIFAPEHGFRGAADAGEHIQNSRDARTGVQIVSLYGSKKAPDAQDLQNIDVLVFDMQDVGTRFYTYLSTLYYVLDAAAVHQKPLLLLDRPNPNGHYVDGPVLKPQLKSFVGVIPIPIVHGCTLGELAQMMIGEGWLPSQKRPNLTVIPCEKYTHASEYILPLPPSPNLRSQLAIYLYPTLCLFEGTEVSVGRGTDHPFEQFGSPKMANFYHSFIPESRPGATKPPHLGVECFGRSFVNQPIEDIRAAGRIRWEWIVEAYKSHTGPPPFFLSSRFFDKLAGTTEICGVIERGAPADALPRIYETELEAYKRMRIKYLIYE